MKTTFEKLFTGLAGYATTITADVLLQVQPETLDKIVHALAQIAIAAATIYSLWKKDRPAPVRKPKIKKMPRDPL